MKQSSTIAIYFYILFVAIIIHFGCTKSDDITGSEVTNENMISLTGRVLDGNNKGVANIETRLSTLDFADTTDINGNYEISVSTDSLEKQGITLDGLEDTLLISTNNELVTTYSIINFIDTLPDIYLVQRNIWGKLLSQGPVPSQIKAVITTDDESWMQLLWLNSATNEFSGFVYTRPPLTSSTYSVYVNVYDSVGRLSGRSDTITFPEFAGDIHIPDFYPTNGVPILAPSTAYVNKDVQFSSNDIDTVGNNIQEIKWEFVINDSLVGTAVGHNVTHKFYQEGACAANLYITDGIGHTVSYIKWLRIVNPVGTIDETTPLLPDTVTINDTLHFSIKVTDPEGVKKILWDFGEGDLNRPQFDSTLNSTISNVSHVWPSETTVPLGESKIFNVQVCIIDSLDDTTTASVPITVSNLKPTITISDSAPKYVSSGEKIIIEFDATDDNRIEHYSYSHGGQTFSTDNELIELIIPEMISINYPITISVSDDDKNSANYTIQLGVNTWCLTKPEGTLSGHSFTFEHFYSVKNINNSLVLYSHTYGNECGTLYFKEWHCPDTLSTYTFQGIAKNKKLLQDKSLTQSKPVFKQTSIFVVTKSELTTPSWMEKISKLNDNLEEEYSFTECPSQAINETPEGNILIIHSDSTLTKYSLLSKYSRTGEHIWTTKAQVKGISCFEDRENIIRIFTEDGKLVLLNSTGDIINSIELSFSNIQTVLQLNDGNFLLNCKLDSKSYLVKVDINGIALWNFSTGDSEVIDVTTSPNGDICFGQNINSNIVLTILNEHGVLKHKNSLLDPNSMSGGLRSVTYSPDETYIVAGRYSDSSTQPNDSTRGKMNILIKTDKEGRSCLNY